MSLQTWLDSIHYCLSYSYITDKTYLAAQKMFMLVLGKEVGTLSTLHGIANCVKNETTRKIVSSNLSQRLAAVLPTTTFAQI